MTYLESYRSANSVEKVIEMAKEDAKIALFLGNNPDRIKAIEDAMNQAINELEEAKMDGEEERE